jgi:hypothetical protein
MPESGSPLSATPAPSDPTDPLDQVLAGQCIHGHTSQRDCGACLMTRYLAVSLRQLLAGVFGSPRA